MLKMAVYIFPMHSNARDLHRANKGLYIYIHESLMIVFLGRRPKMHVNLGGPSLGIILEIVLVSKIFVMFYMFNCTVIHLEAYFDIQ